MDKGQNKEYWDMVMKCEHEYSDYFDSGRCETPYCEWEEVRCKKCYVYITKCKCHYYDGMSEWPMKRFRKMM